MTNSTYDRRITLYRNGATDREMARRERVSTTAIVQWRGRLGLTVNPARSRSDRPGKARRR